MSRALPLLLLGLTLACGGPADTANTGADDASGDDPLFLVTQDGVRLAADLYPVDGSTKAVVLLHMNPSGGFNRTNWPSDFITTLTGEGWTVLNLDRRGAGESNGDAEDAYEGPNGKLDVYAATQYLDGESIETFALIGASNGTTSVVDYMQNTRTASDWPRIDGAVLMSPGDYTENQVFVHVIPPEPPVLFLYDTSEADWPEDQTKDALDPWTFTPLAGAGHGTNMFDGPQASEATTAIMDLLDEID